LAQAVRDTLEWNALVPASLIRSTVADGSVTLEGEVESLTQRDDAEKAIEHMTGLRRVINNIVVKPQRPVKSEEVQQALARALARRAVRESDRLRVQAENGIITLSGSVHTWSERRAVIGAARGTPGVCSVRDELRIEP
jgi:osmotically-inducible protein OsmY